MHCKGWCTGWNQWHNLLPLVYGCWLRWWHCTGDELSAIFPIKNSKKICNNNIATKKRQDGYNPNYRFDYLRRCLIQNVKFITKHAGLDLCGDFTSWETSSYGEGGTGLTGKISTILVSWRVVRQSWSVTSTASGLVHTCTDTSFMWIILVVIYG